ncbi:glycosyltransferase family 4 protein [Flavobacteriaceae bacterium]|nr:glycosyltransferase family 4 protein [Flavobacteriaceae bacterium]
MLWHISERGGGAEVQANYLAQELVERGYSVSYICQTTKNAKANTTTVVNGVQIHWLKPAKKFIWLNNKAYLKVLKLVKPEVIIQRNSSPILWASAKYSKKSSAKLIWVCSDNLAPFYNFFTKRYKSRNTIKELGPVKYSVFYLNAIISDKLRNSAMKCVYVAFSQNEFQKLKIKKNFGLDSFKIISGHPLPDKTTVALNSKTMKNILWCANWGKHKRPELFVALARNMADSNYNFIMIGGHSDKGYVDQLLKDCPKNLKVTGQLSFEDALSYFNEASLFVNTSTPDGDGFPNTFIQSWLRGVPVLSFGFNPDEVITKNQLGFVVPSVNDAKDTCSQLLENEIAYANLSINVLDYANRNHTVKVMTDHFINRLSKNS